MQLKPTDKELKIISQSGTPVKKASEARPLTKIERRKIKAAGKAARKAANARRQEPRAVIRRDGEVFVQLQTGQQVRCEIFYEKGGAQVVIWPGMPVGRRFVIGETHKSRPARS